MSHAVRDAVDRSAPSRSPLTFGGTIRSEQIKLFSLRSTIWCYAILVALTIALSFLVAAAYLTLPPPPAEAQQATWVQSATSGILFSQLVVAVLGVLVISGEYGTGMIRSTFAAVPRRVPALVAKALVIGLVTFVIALVSLVVAALLPSGLLASGGIQPDLGDSGAWWALVGGAGYLALLAVLALAIGAIVRNSAGALATVFGLILVLPGALTAIAAIIQSSVPLNVAAFLPAAAGQRMFAYVSNGGDAIAASDLITLEPWQGLLVLVAWVVVLFGVAAALIRRRDV